MPVQASLRFVQGPNSDVAGRAVVGTLTDGACAVSNGNNTGVVSWKYELLYVPPGSSVPLTVQGPGIVQTLSFTPDKAGSYRVRLTVTGATVSDVDVDIRCFCVPFPNGIVAAPYQRNPAPLPLTGVGGKPDEMNIAGQPFGWDGVDSPGAMLMYQVLKFIDGLVGAGPGPYLPLDGSAAMTGDLDHGNNGFLNTSFGIFGAPAPGIINKVLYVLDGLVDFARETTAPHETGVLASLSTIHSTAKIYEAVLNATYNNVPFATYDMFNAYAVSDFSNLTINALNVEHDNAPFMVAVSTMRQVSPLRQWYGVLTNAGSIVTTPGSVDVTADLAFGGPGNVSAFPLINTGLIVGDASKFTQIEIQLDTVASGNGIDFSFECSTGVGTWTSISSLNLEDRTGGLTKNGKIRIVADNLTTWAPGAGGSYLIRMLRTAAVVTTVPILDRIQIAGGFVYGWTEEADVFARSYRFSRYTSAPGPDTAATLWFDGFLDRLRIGSNTLAYLSEIPSLSTTYITPPALAGTVNDYTPTGWSTATHIRQDSTGDQSITGFGPATTSWNKIFFNISATTTITLEHLDGGSLAANQIACPDNVDFSMPPRSGVVLNYDPTSLQWRVTALPRGIRGSLGATDRAIAITNGTAGWAAQGSDVTISAAGLVAGVLAGFTLTAQAVNPGAGNTVWVDNAVNRARQGANILAYQNEIPAYNPVVISPPAIAAQADNYNPAGLATCTHMRITLTGNQTMTGLTAPTAGAISMRVLHNIDTTDTLTLAHLNGSSSAANQFVCPGGADLQVPPLSTVTLIYDYTSAGWRPETIRLAFDRLSDVPATKSGQGGKLVYVNAAGTALAYSGSPEGPSFYLHGNSNSGAGVSAAGAQTLSPLIGSWVPSTFRIRLGTAPSVSSLQVDIKANGTSIISGGSPITINTGVTTVSGNLNTAARAAGDIITIETIGSDVAWNKLQVDCFGTVLLP